MILRSMQRSFSLLVLVLASCAPCPQPTAAPGYISGHCQRQPHSRRRSLRDEGLQFTSGRNTKLAWKAFREQRQGALLVHGGTWSGRPLFDLQIRDYSLMDFLAENGYDVWAIDLHGYGRSDKTDKDWTDSHSAAADIAAAVGYITRLRGVSKINLLGCSAGTQRAGVFAMENPDKVTKLVLYAPWWKGNAELNEFRKKRMENDGKPLPQYRDVTEESIRSDFVRGDLAQHPQVEADVVDELKEVLQANPQAPNTFVENAHLPILIRPNH